MKQNALHPLGSLLPALLLLAACTPGPEPIRYGLDGCDYCKMTLSDERYGAELVTRKGKVFKFDSVECLSAFHQAAQGAPGDVHSVWVTDFEHPGRLIPAEEAFYLHSPDLRSPMGMNLTAFGSQTGPEAVLDTHGGTVVRWQDVQRMVREAWMQKPGLDTGSASHRPVHGGAGER